MSAQVSERVDPGYTPGRYEYAVLAVLSAAFAFAVFDSGPGNDLVPLAATTTILLAGAVLWVARLRPAGPIEWGRAHIAVLLYMGLLVVNYFTSTLAENTLYFACMFGAFAVAFVLTASLREGPRYRLLAGLALIGGFSACWGIAEFVVTLDRANGPIIDPNAWASMCNLLFLGVLASTYQQRRVAVWQVVLMFLFAFAVAVSYSRLGAFILLAAGASLVAVGLIRAELRRCAGVGMLCVLAAFGTVEIMLAANDTEVRDRTSVGLAESGWRERGYMWRAGFDMATDHPLGTGLGTFRAQYPAYRDTREYRTVGNYVHNDYLQVAAEGGLGLAIMLVALVGLLTWRFFAELRAVVGGDIDRVPVFGAIVAMGSVFVHALMNFPLYQLPNLMLLGVLFAHVAAASGWTTIVAAPDLRPVLLRFAAAAVTVLVTVSLWADALTDRIVIRPDSSVAAFFRASEERYFETVRILRLLRPGNSLNHFALATLYRQSGDRIEDARGTAVLAAAAAEQYASGLERNPFHFAVAGYLADLLSQHPRLAREMGHADATELRLDAATRARTSLRAHLLYSRHLPHDARFEYLSTHAVPWLDLRAETTRGDRLEIIRIVGRGALVRGDEALLSTLLASLEEELRYHGWKTGERARRSHLCVGTWRATLGC